MSIRHCLLVALGLAFVSVPTASKAVNVLGITIRAGYTFSGSFTNSAGQSTTLQGPELGVDIPIGPRIPIPKFGSLGFALAGSWFAGGGLQSGSGTKGNVYRILFTSTAPLGASGLYLRGGVGFAAAQGVNGSFSNGNAFESLYAIGIPIIGNLPVFKLNAEVAYHQSSLAQASGFTIGLNGSF